MPKNSIDDLFSEWDDYGGGKIFGSTRNDKSRLYFLEYILKPVEEAINLGICSPEVKMSDKKSNLVNHFEKYSKVSLKQSYYLFQELAYLHEKAFGENGLKEASESLYFASKIAQKANAKGVANKLLTQSAEALEKYYGETSNVNWISQRQAAFKRAGNNERYAEIVERDYKNLLKDGKNVGVGIEDPANAFYNAGQYSKAADYVPHTSQLGLRALRKAGRFEDLVNAYQQLSKHYHDEGREDLAKRYETNARKITQKGLEKGVLSIIAGGLLVGGLILLSPKITGNAIAKFSTNTTSWIGGVLLVVGLVAGFFWIKKEKNKKK